MVARSYKRRRIRKGGSCGYKRALTRDHCDGIGLYVDYDRSHLTLHMIKLYENRHTQMTAYKIGEN